MLSTCTFRRLLNISEEGYSTASLGNLCAQGRRREIVKVKGDSSKEGSMRLLEPQLLPLVRTSCRQWPWALLAWCKRRSQGQGSACSGGLRAAHTSLCQNPSFPNLVSSPLPKCTLLKAIVAPGSWHIVFGKSPKAGMDMTVGQASTRQML